MMTEKLGERAFKLNFVVKNKNARKTHDKRTRVFNQVNQTSERSRSMKYYILILGIWIRVPEKVFYKCDKLWTKMSK